MELSDILNLLSKNDTLSDLERIRFTQSKVRRPLLSAEIEALGVTKERISEMVTEGKLLAHEVETVLSNEWGPSRALAVAYFVADLLAKN